MTFFEKRGEDGFRRSGEGLVFVKGAGGLGFSL